MSKMCFVKRTQIERRLVQRVNAAFARTASLNGISGPAICEWQARMQNHHPWCEDEIAAAAQSLQDCAVVLRLQSARSLSPMRVRQIKECDLKSARARFDSCFVQLQAAIDSFSCSDSGEGVTDSARRST